MRVGSSVLVVALAVAVPAAGQAPEAAPPQPPVFGVGVDIVALDASVVDAEGRPVLGLGPEDFRAEIDGRPRRVVSVEYIGRDLEAPAPPSARPTHFSSNEDVPRGRLILLLVDRGNIGQGGGRDVLRSAERFLGTLGPADRVGLAFVPGPGPSIEFTPDVDLVRRGLKGVVGQAPRGGSQVPLSEAIALVKDNDRMRWAQFVDIRCGFFKIPEQAEACRQEMVAEANQVYLQYRDRSLASQRALGNVLRSLTGIEGAKTVLLVSEGLGTEDPSEVRELAVAAAEAQVTLYVLLLNTSRADAAFSRSEPADFEDRETEAAGLYDLAGLTRGSVLQVVGTGEGAFRRVAQELAGYYVLGLDPEEGDRDGRSHEVRLKVARPNVTVHARGVLKIPTKPPAPQALLAAALRSPLVDRGLPIRATAYALRDGATGKVRLLVSARVGRAARPLSVGFAVSSPTGKVAASRAYEGIAGGDGEWVDFTGEAVVDPATYSLRLAAVDASGRRGSVEHTVKAALVSAGGIEISDLVLAPASDGGAVRPAVDLELEGGGLSALVELGGRDSARVDAAAVAIELADRPDGPALLRVPVALGAAKDGTRVAQVRVAGGLLPPGDYVARAEVSVEGKAVAVVTRPFRLLPPRPGAPAAGAPLASLLVETPPFDRAELLKAETLGHFVDRVIALQPGPVPAGMAAALAEARQGRAEAMLDRLADAGKEDPRASFLRGVALYARGNLPAALTQLQAALGHSSELFPAAVYLGACYAASGKDLDAIGAWQTALIGESGGSPALYGVLSDALARVGESQQAVEILDEGLGAFPQDEGLRRRLGIAYAKAGRSEDALPLLTSWVDAHPDDSGAAFAMLALLFEGFSRETAGEAPAGERERLVRFARAYVDGKGPNREMIACWLRFLDARPGG